MAATGATACLINPAFGMMFLLVEAVSFCCVLRLGGRRRWRTFLWLCPVVWALTALFGSALVAARAPDPWPLLTVLVSLHAPRLLACCVARSPAEHATVPPMRQLAGLFALGLACGAAYAWLLTAGVIDAWDADVRRQVIYQTAPTQVLLGLASGCGAVCVALLASNFVPPASTIRNGEEESQSGSPVPWSALTVLLAGATVLAWTFRLVVAVTGDNMAVEGGVLAGVIAWGVGSVLAGACWAGGVRTREAKALARSRAM